MNTEEIIDMARKAGMRLDKHNGGFVDASEIKRFAKLVDAKATARERLGCFEAAYGAYATTEVLEAIRNRGDL